MKETSHQWLSALPSLRIIQEYGKISRGIRTGLAMMMTLTITLI